MKKLGNFLLFIIMIVLIGGIAVFGWYLYNQIAGWSESTSSIGANETYISVEDGTEITKRKETQGIGKTIKEIFSPAPTPTQVAYSPKASQGKYFYEQLSETQKIIYNGFQENKENLKSGTYSIQYGDKFAEVLELENGSKILGNDYQAAIDAFTHDNSDLFFLDVSKMYLNMEKKTRAFKTTYNVYIGPKDGMPYLANGFNSETEVRIAFDKIEEVKNKVKAKLTGDAYKDTKIIHDFLVDNLEYDENYTSKSPYSIYGALVEKKCVCEGYAKAFKYLADMAGLENVLVQGEATNSNGEKEKHAWNAVKVKWDWYLVDATWDDPIIVGRGIVATNTHYKYFLKGTKNFNKDHQPEYQFSDEGKVFSYPTISVTDY